MGCIYYITLQKMNHSHYICVGCEEIHVSLKLLEADWPKCWLPVCTKQALRPASIDSCSIQFYSVLPKDTTTKPAGPNKYIYSLVFVQQKIWYLAVAEWLHECEEANWCLFMNPVQFYETKRGREERGMSTILDSGFGGIISNRPFQHVCGKQLNSCTGTMFKVSIRVRRFHDFKQTCYMQPECLMLWWWLDLL